MLGPRNVHTSRTLDTFHPSITTWSIWLWIFRCRLSFWQLSRRYYHQRDRTFQLHALKPWSLKPLRGSSAKGVSLIRGILCFFIAVYFFVWWVPSSTHNRMEFASKSMFGKKKKFLATPRGRAVKNYFRLRELLHMVSSIKKFSIILKRNQIYFDKNLNGYIFKCSNNIRSDE